MCNYVEYVETYVVVLNNLDSLLYNVIPQQGNVICGFVTYGGILFHTMIPYAYICLYYHSSFLYILFLV